MKEFTQIYPEYTDRTFIAYKIVPVEDILKKAEGDCTTYNAVTKDELKL